MHWIYNHKHTQSKKILDSIILVLISSYVANKQHGIITQIKKINAVQLFQILFPFRDTKFNPWQNSLFYLQILQFTQLQFTFTRTALCLFHDNNWRTSWLPVNLCLHLYFLIVLRTSGSSSYNIPFGICARHDNANLKNLEYMNIHERC